LARGNKIMIWISNTQTKIKINRKNLRRIVEKVLKGLGCSHCETSILLVDDNTMTQMNKRYLNRQGATNVLAFPMREGLISEINPHVLGDVVISVETAEREAEEAQITFEARLCYLLIHGILHLLGYNHEGSRKDREIMEKKTKNLLSLLNQAKMKNCNTKIKTSF